MSTFKVPVIEILDVQKHENADSLDLAQVAGYRSVILRDQYKPGDVAVYIPEQAILPADVIEILGLTGRLAGKDQNRVKIIKLRGEISQGIIMSLEKVRTILEARGLTFNAEVGEDVSELLGITKYEPPVPAHLAGDVANVYEARFKYDIENYQNYPDILQDGELVQATEKLHGTFCGAGLIPGLNHPEVFANGDGIVFSKGMGAQGLVFKDSESNTHNLYVKTIKDFNIHEKLKEIIKDEVFGSSEDPLYIFGEIFGNKVQDLQYGMVNSKRMYRMFDAYVGKYGTGRYLNFEEKTQLAEMLGVEMVPILYVGPFNLEKMTELRDGKETISGTEAHMREGIVITPLINRDDYSIGRVILKFVSPTYLLRKGDTTEFN